MDCIIIQYKRSTMDKLFNIWQKYKLIICYVFKYDNFNVVSSMFLFIRI
jgi:hypothetical protein